MLPGKTFEDGQKNVEEKEIEYKIEVLYSGASLDYFMDIADEILEEEEDKTIGKKEDMKADKENIEAKKETSSKKTNRFKNRTFQRW